MFFLRPFTLLYMCNALKKDNSYFNSKPKILTSKQEKYIGIKKEGPFKSDSYRY